MKKVYEVWEDWMNIEGMYPDGLSEDDILDMFFSYVTYPTYVDVFDNLEEAQKCAKKGVITYREDGFIKVTYRYIEELEYESEDDCPTENGTIDYFVEALEPIKR